jgi:hypothetical protein
LLFGVQGQILLNDAEQQDTSRFVCIYYSPLGQNGGFA